MTTPTPATTAEPAWLTTARSYFGVREYTAQRPGPNGELSNPLIERWQALAGIRRPDDAVPWCAAGVTGWLCETGLTDFHTSSARAFGHYGVATAPRVGCITVLWREDPNGPHGHVGLLVAWTATTITLLGANQGDAVKTASFQRSRLIPREPFRWPSSKQLAAAHLDGDGLRTRG